MPSKDALKRKLNKVPAEDDPDWDWRNPNHNPDQTRHLGPPLLGAPVKQKYKGPQGPSKNPSWISLKIKNLRDPQPSIPGISAKEQIANAGKPLKGKELAEYEAWKAAGSKPDNLKKAIHRRQYMPKK
jgi:hypothetical protein